MIDKNSRILYLLFFILLFHPLSANEAAPAVRTTIEEQRRDIMRFGTCSGSM